MPERRYNPPVVNDRIICAYAVIFTNRSSYPQGNSFLALHIELEGGGGHSRSGRIIGEQRNLAAAGMKLLFVGRLSVAR
jgi:hypothetical protein